ncbi:MAG: class II fumarate hydratase [Spirochaetaceae bacterium]|nr:MAG: class II fumarate hydratase [Spirochaetaceae bacterium]
MSSKTREESDSMGPVSLPEWAYWGAQTQRAVENFGVSPLRIHPAMIRALGLIKKNAAEVNASLGTLDENLASAISRAADEVVRGKWDGHFPIDVFQTGSGTSWNMNANELIANRANELLGQARGTRSPVHPNDHVNRGQSSNDVIPTAIHIANRMQLEPLLAAVRQLAASLRRKEEEFAHLVKLGRTHLQDAVPMTLGQEFSGFAVQIEKAVGRIAGTAANLEELALGGTALGTGINCAPGFAEQTAQAIARETGLPFRSAPNKFEAIASRDAQVELMGALNTLATSLMKIANDLRLLASGPRGALGEIVLPSLQPGSSIMPGKVNPVIPEMVIQVAAHVNGKAVSVTIAGQNGPLELNMMNPLISHETLSSMELLEKTCRVLAEKAIDGLEADRERLEYWIEWSLALVTPLATEIGYDKATKLAYQAYREKRTIREVVLESGVLPEERVRDLLDPAGMI